MNAPSTTDTIQTTAPIALWRVAAAFMHILHALFGAPEDVAARHTLRFEAHKLMASWLRAGEAMMRRLLIIEAAAYARPNIRPLLRETRKRTRKPMHFTPDAPQKWRVSFRCFTSTKGLSPSKAEAKHTELRQAQGPTGPRPFIVHEREDFRGLRPSKPRANRKRAQRTRYRPILRQDREWVMRSEPIRFRSPWPLAERYEALLRAFNTPGAYARRLARQIHATPHRLRELLHAPPEAARRVEGFAELTAAAEAKAAMFNST